MRTIAITSLCMVLFVVVPVRAADDTAARAIIDKAIQAAGGDKNLAKLNVRRIKGKGTIVHPQAGEGKVTAELFQQLPDKTRSVITYSFPQGELMMSQVVNGDQGWMSARGRTVELPGEELARRKESLYRDQLETLIPLKSKEYKLSLLEEITVDGRPATGIQVAAKGHSDVKLYFDNNTALLTQIEYETQDRTGKKVARKSINSDFKEVEGVKVAMKNVAYEDGKKVLEVRTTEVEFPKKLDDNLFAKPE